MQRKDRQNLRVWKVSARQMRCASPLFHTVLFIPLFAPRRPAAGSALGSVMGWPGGVTHWSKQQTAARCSSHPGPCAHETRQECYLVWTKHPVRLVFSSTDVSADSNLSFPGSPTAGKTPLLARFWLLAFLLRFHIQYDTVFRSGQHFRQG